MESAIMRTYQGFELTHSIYRVSSGMAIWLGGALQGISTLTVHDDGRQFLESMFELNQEGFVFDDGPKKETRELKVNKIPIPGMNIKGWRLFLQHVPFWSENVHSFYEVTSEALNISSRKGARKIPDETPEFRIKHVLYASNGYPLVIDAEMWFGSLHPGSVKLDEQKIEFFARA